MLFLCIIYLSSVLMHRRASESCLTSSIQQPRCSNNIEEVFGDLLRSSAGHTDGGNSTHWNLCLTHSHIAAQNGDNTDSDVSSVCEDTEPAPPAPCKKQVASDVLYAFSHHTIAFIASRQQQSARSGQLGWRCDIHIGTRHNTYCATTRIEQ